MSQTAHRTLMEKLRSEAKEGGLIVRFEKHGVLVICLPEFGPTPQSQPDLGLPVEARQEDSANPNG